MEIPLKLPGGGGGGGWENPNQKPMMLGGFNRLFNNFEQGSTCTYTQINSHAFYLLARVSFKSVAMNKKEGTHLYTSASQSYFEQSK